MLCITGQGHPFLGSQCVPIKRWLRGTLFNASVPQNVDLAFILFNHKCKISAYIFRCGHEIDETVICVVLFG